MREEYLQLLLGILLRGPRIPGFYDIFVAAALDFVENTFVGAVLTGEGPGVTVCVFVSVAVGNVGYISHFKEAFSVKRLMDAPACYVLAIRTK